VFYGSQQQSSGVNALKNENSFWNNFFNDSADTRKQRFLELLFGQGICFYEISTAWQLMTKRNLGEREGGGGHPELAKRESETKNLNGLKIPKEYPSFFVKVSAPALLLFLRWVVRRRAGTLFVQNWKYGFKEFQCNAKVSMRVETITGVLF